MTTSEPTLLVVDDEANMRHVLRSILKRHGYIIKEAASGIEGLKQLDSGPVSYVLCDVRMPEMDGLTFLSKARRRYPDLTLIMMSAYGTIEDAVKAMKLGAYDYIAKPFKEDEILLVLQKAEERDALQEENKRLKGQVGRSGAMKAFGGMVGNSTVMQEVFALATRVAQYDTTVLVTGESGTGKELIAKGIHERGKQKEGPFVAINCGSIPENLLESELFGYVKGAFTGAESNKPGLFETASKGTLFLDEVAELPLAMQVKLLRVLQENEIRRVGASKAVQLNVRVLAATSRNLSEMIQARQFREDLYYRLNVVNVHLPPLRERKGDIHHLCSYFINVISARLGRDIVGIDPHALDLMVNYTWPGNVRELENTLERAIIYTEKKMISPENLPGHFGWESNNRQIDDFLGTYSLKKAKVTVEKKLIVRAMDAAEGNKSKAARMLEISYPALLSKLKAYGC